MPTPISNRLTSRPPAPQPVSLDDRLYIEQGGRGPYEISVASLFDLFRGALAAAGAAAAGQVTLGDQLISLDDDILYLD